MQTFTPKQATKILHVSDDQVRQLIADGELVASNVSGGTKRARWVITQADIESFLRRRRNVKPRARRPKAAEPKHSI